MNDRANHMTSIAKELTIRAAWVIGSLATLLGLMSAFGGVPKMPPVVPHAANTFVSPPSTSPANPYSFAWGPRLGHSLPADTNMVWCVYLLTGSGWQLEDVLPFSQMTWHTTNKSCIFTVMGTTGEQIGSAP